MILAIVERWENSFLYDIYQKNEMADLAFFEKFVGKYVDRNHKIWN